MLYLNIKHRKERKGMTYLDIADTHSKLLNYSAPLDIGHVNIHIQGTRTEVAVL